MEYEESELPAGLAELRPGNFKRLGRYELLRKLATGGMASVYLAHMTGEPAFQKFVAIKCPHPNLVSNPAILQMFLNEARILAQLDHENICPIIDFGSDPKGPYIVMPYLHGEPLGILMQHYASTRKPVPVDLMAYIAADVCDGLYYAHNLTGERRPLGLVHRDISPHNIFITFDGSVKILDFGVAKAIGIDGHSVAGQPKGKYAYMSPEQVRGEALDHRSDLFSLGIVLWESLAGRRLFRRDTPAMTLFAIEQAHVPPLREANRDVPDELAKIVTRALSRSRQDRLPSAREMGRELRVYLAHRTAALCPTEVAHVMRECFPRRAEDRDPLASVTEPRGLMKPRPSSAPEEEISEGKSEQTDPSYLAGMSPGMGRSALEPMIEVPIDDSNDGQSQPNEDSRDDSRPIQVRSKSMPPPPPPATDPGLGPGIGEGTRVDRARGYESPTARIDYLDALVSSISAIPRSEAILSNVDGSEDDVDQEDDPTEARERGEVPLVRPVADASPWSRADVRKSIPPAAPSIPPPLPRHSKAPPPPPEASVPGVELVERDQDERDPTVRGPVVERDRSHPTLDPNERAAGLPLPLGLVSLEEPPRAPPGQFFQPSVSFEGATPAARGSQPPARARPVRLEDDDDEDPVDQIAANRRRRERVELWLMAVMAAMAAGLLVYLGFR